MQANKEFKWVLNPIQEEPAMPGIPFDEDIDHYSTERTSTPTSITSSMKLQVEEIASEFNDESYVEIEKVDDFEVPLSMVETKSHRKPDFNNDFVIIEPKEDAKFNDGLIEIEVIPPIKDENDNSESSRTTSPSIITSQLNDVMNIYYTANSEPYMDDSSLVYHTAYVGETTDDDDEDLAPNFKPISPPQKSKIAHEKNTAEQHDSKTEKKLQPPQPTIDVNEIIIDFPPSYDRYLNLVGNNEPIEDRTPYIAVIQSEKKDNILTRAACSTFAKKPKPQMPIDTHMGYYRYLGEELYRTNGLDKSTQTHITVTKTGEKILHGDFKNHSYIVEETAKYHRPRHLPNESVVVIESQVLQSEIPTLREGRPTTFYRQASVTASKKLKRAAEAIDEFRIPIIIVSVLLFLVFVALIVMGTVFPLV